MCVCVCVFTCVCVCVCLCFSKVECAVCKEKLSKLFGKAGTDSGMRTKALVELVDIFPTLTELAGLDVPLLCPENNKNLLACTEGTSLVPLLKNPDQQWKKAAFSQYVRPQYAGLFKIPGHPVFNNTYYAENVMGYSIRVDQYRFVEWYSFNNVSGIPDYSKVWGTELYDHTRPSAFFDNENANFARI